MKKILTACGYNHAWAFKETDNEKITELESFVQTRHRKIVDSFEEYEEIDPFVFLPGHRSLIFGIKAEILSMEDSKKPKLKPKAKNDVDENELKTNLITQLTTFLSSIALRIDWNDSIQSLEVEKNENGTLAKCSILCPICNAQRVVRYDNKYWKLSNMTKHLRNHNGANKSEKQPKKKLNNPPLAAMKNITNKKVRQSGGLNQKDGENDGVGAPFDTQIGQDFSANLTEDVIIYDPSYDDEDLILHDDENEELEDAI